MIFYDFLRFSPVGEMLVGATVKGVCFVTFGQKSKNEKLQRLQNLFPETEVVEDESCVESYCIALKRYFDGDLKVFNLPLNIDNSCTSFQKRLYEALLQVPYGKVVTYGTLARKIGIPKGARAVGDGMRRNPIPIIIPCHRVVAARGALGGFSGGITYKKTLLRLEGYLKD